MSKGTVKWFNTKRDMDLFSPRAEKRYLCPYYPIGKAGIRRLFDGQAVNYDIYADRDGKPAAGNIRVYSPDYRSVVRERSSEMRAVSCIKKTPAHGREFDEEREAATAP